MRKRLPSSEWPAIANVTVICCNRPTSFRYSTSSFMTTGPSLRRENSLAGNPFSEKNIMRTSADLSRNAVFLMCELKSMSAQLAKSIFEYRGIFLYRAWNSWWQTFKLTGGPRRRSRTTSRMPAGPVEHLRSVKLMLQIRSQPLRPPPVQLRRLPIRRPYLQYAIAPPTLTAPHSTITTLDHLTGELCSHASPPDESHRALADFTHPSNLNPGLVIRSATAALRASTNRKIGCATLCGGTPRIE